MFEISNKARLTVALIGIVSFALLAGCSSEPEPVEEEVAAEETSQPAPQRAGSGTTNAPIMEELPPIANDNNYRFVPNAQGQLAESGPGLVSTLDGSSTESFKESLNWIAADTSAEQYAKLESAIRYINLYDPSVVGSDENMRQLLNGMTGEEAIAYAERLERSRDVGNQ